jgi:hypothetical protein
MTHANPERLDCLLRELPPLKQCSTGGTRHGHCPYCPAVVSISTGARCCGVCFRHKRENEGTPPWAMGPSSHSAPNVRKRAPVDGLRQDGRDALPSFLARMTSQPIGIAVYTQAPNVSAGYRANGDTGSVTPYTPLSPRYDAYAAPYSPTSPRYSPATPVWSPAASPSPRYNTVTPRYSPWFHAWPSFILIPVQWFAPSLSSMLSSSVPGLLCPPSPWCLLEFPDSPLCTPPEIGTLPCPESPIFVLTFY